MLLVTMVAKEVVVMAKKMMMLVPDGQHLCGKMYGRRE